jgi:hypothetical protein
MNIVELRDRLTEIIEHNVSGYSPNRNSSPVYFRLCRGRNDWYIPIDSSDLNCALLIRNLDGYRQDGQIMAPLMGSESDAIKEGSRKNV